MPRQKPRRSPGQPTKLTPEREERIIEATLAGHTRRAAAAHGGVHVDTLQEWLRRGRAGDAKYSEFSERFDLADGRAELSVITDWRRAVTHDWRAAQAFAARRWPSSWGPRDRMELQVSNPDGTLKPLIHIGELILDPQVQQHVRALRDRELELELGRNGDAPTTSRTHGEDR
jgi:hypothetical protein